MNADLTVSLMRYPEGEWVAIRAETMLDDGGRGLASSLLFDRQGPIGRDTQTPFLDPRRARRAPQFRQGVAVEGATFRLEPGEVVGFLGPNGAGKTTPLKMLSGLL